MKRFLTLAMTLVLAITITACGDDGAATSAPATIAAPDATAAPATAAVPIDLYPLVVLGVAIPARPERIVSASATHTEILYAIGAGDRVVATDFFSNYPPEAEATEKMDAFNVNVEGLAALDPDLVILSYDPGDVVAGLESLGIAAILFPAPLDLEQAFGQITDTGRAVGESDAAADLVEGMTRRIDAVVAALPAGGDRPTYYYELGTDLYSVTSATFIGGILSLLGMENVADPADTEGYGYPQLSAEFILDADPDFVILADTRAARQSAATLAERPGWDSLSAVAAGRVIELDDDVASRWGPRLADLIETVAAAVHGDR